MAMLMKRFFTLLTFYLPYFICILALVLYGEA